MTFFYSKISFSSKYIVIQHKESLASLQKKGTPTEIKMVSMFKGFLPTSQSKARLQSKEIIIRLEKKRERRKIVFSNEKANRTQIKV